MGYSIGLHARSKAQQRKMLDFMEKEYRPHWQIRDLKDYTTCYSSPPTDDPSYCHGKTIIGIDFNCAGFERGYIHTLVKWMALKVGTQRSTFTEPKARFKSPVPCMTYDGDSPWPILVKDPETVPKKLRWCCVDKYGMRLHPSGAADYVFDLKDPDSYEKASREARRKLGLPETPGYSPSSKEERELFREAIDETQCILWPQVQELLIPIRTEMKRLDLAWAESV